MAIFQVECVIEEIISIDNMIVYYYFLLPAYQSERMFWGGENQIFPKRWNFEYYVFS